MTIKAKTKKRAPAKRDWRKMLKTIATFVNVHDKQATDLWAVLSALRGPDATGSNDLKYATTGVLRRAAGIPLGPHWAVSNRDEDRWAARRASLPYDHFGEHLRLAFTALDLKWEERNQ
jgi:hypothetical protein